MTNANKKEAKNTTKVLINTVSVLLTLFLFLISLKMMGDGFKLFGKDIANTIINLTGNPFVSLFVGLLATAIIQSSSTTTSMIVAMVGSGVLTLENAVPMIMGANIGTSVTSTIVSLGHIGSKREYKKAVAAATVHDFFNIMVTLILFPLEFFSGFLSNMSLSVSKFLESGDDSGYEMFDIMSVTVSPVAKFFIELLNKIDWLVVTVSVLLLFVSLRLLTAMLKKLLIGKAESNINKVLFSNPFKALGWGVLITAGVQSSSVTTSLAVPLVASNKVSLQKIFPFLIGANIGTTITALIASISLGEYALAIALAHFFFNVIGAFLIFPIKFMRDIPVKLARSLGSATLKNRLVGLGYIVVVFFLIPFTLILVSSTPTVLREQIYVNKNNLTGEQNYTVTVDKILKDNSIERKYYINLNDHNVNFDTEPNYKKNISRKGKILYFGDEIILLEEKGFCADNKFNEKGKTERCVNDIIIGYRTPDGKVIDTCYVFREYFYNPSEVDSVYEKTYIDISNLEIIKKELYSKQNQVVYYSELMRKK